MTPIELMQDIIRENIPEDIWAGHPLSNWTLLGGTNKGEAGEEFIRRYLPLNGIDVGNGNRTSPYDLTVGPNRIRIEVKAAGLGKTGTFQFNHIRTDKPYIWLVGIGVCPDDILFGAWKKQDVVSGLAGNRVNMAEGQSITGKITKSREDLRPIKELVSWARSI